MSITRTDRKSSVGRRIAAALFLSLGLASLAAGCKSLGLPDNRLQSCQTNDDCKSKDPKKPTCANLRCVECAYDSDCASGMCTGNTCKTLFTGAGEGTPDGPPQNLDACLSRCSDDQACVNKCNEQFRPVEPPK